MEALIIAATEKSQSAISELVNRMGKFDITVASNGALARRQVLLRQFDLYVVNAGFSDERGNELANFLISREDGGVIYIDDYERIDSTYSQLAEQGIIVLPRPLSRQSFMQALQIVYATNMRISRLRKKNIDLMTKLEDMRYVNRAKFALIKALGYSEEQAHKYIEKKAMDMRMTRRAVAIDILKTYEP